MDDREALKQELAELIDGGLDEPRFIALKVIALMLRAGPNTSPAERALAERVKHAMFQDG